MTTTSLPETVAVPTRPHGASYWRLWRGVPRELAYLLIAFPIALIAFVTTVTLTSVGLGTLILVFIGLVLLIAALYVARGTGNLDRELIGWTGRPRIPAPRWTPAAPGSGVLGWLKSVVANGHYWTYLAHALIVSLPLSLITWTLTISWLSTGLGGVSYWFWQGFVPAGDDRYYLSEAIARRFGQTLADPQTAEGILALLTGVIFLATLPFITRGMTWLHWLVARPLVGGWRSDTLQATVTSLTEARSAAQSAEGHSLRRLERDIHDGPQQRLVRLQMDLAAADRQLADDPDGARTLIGEAMQHSRDALEELRALSRGFAPPILLDRGLVAALESAAARSSIPTVVVDGMDAPAAAALPQEVQRNAYFAASEALANAAKHSSASLAEVRLGSSAGDANAPGLSWLEIRVTDDGIGGAVITAGHGLDGLDERMRGLGGSLQVSSPTGGPTVVTARLPYEAVAHQGVGTATP